MSGYNEVRDKDGELPSTTHRINTGYGRLYVTIVEDENGRPFEIFTNIGDSGGLTPSFSEGISKTASIALRSGTNPEELADVLRGIQSPKVAWDNGDRISSIPDAIGVAMERWLEEKGDALDFENTPEGEQEEHGKFTKSEVEWMTGRGEAYELIEEHGPISHNKLAEKLGMWYTTASQYTGKLMEEGLIEGNHNGYTLTDKEPREIFSEPSPEDWMEENPEDEKTIPGIEEPEDGEGDSAGNFKPTNHVKAEDVELSEQETMHPRYSDEEAREALTEEDTSGGNDSKELPATMESGEKPSQQSGEMCPECHQPTVRMIEGCRKCLNSDCHFSEC